MTDQVILNANGQVDGLATLPVIKALMAKQNLNHSAVARVLGMTRNQVIGIRQRHDLDALKKESVQRKHSSFGSERFNEGSYRPRTCQYIKGNILTDEHKCGQPVMSGQSYCEEHHARCHNKIPLIADS